MTKVAVAFRSHEGLGHVCEGVGAIVNMRVAVRDVFAESEAVFN